MTNSIRSVNYMGNAVYLEDHHGQRVSPDQTCTAADGQGWKVLGGNGPASSETNGTIRVQNLKTNRVIWMDPALVGMRWAE